MAIDIEDRADIETDEAVDIVLIPGLSGYAEPQGHAFVPGTDRQLRFRGSSRPLEAYGYLPKEPGATPVPFWGDAYIKKDPVTQRPRTLWHSVKRLVNSEVFLPRWDGKRLPAVIKKSRTKAIAKFLSPEYHRHLNQAYEALWALTEAIRERAAAKETLAVRLPLDDTACAAIAARAAQMSNVVGEKKNTCYRSPRLIHLVRTLEVRGYAPQHRLVPQSVEQLLSDMFEMICADFVRGAGSYTEVFSGFTIHGEDGGGSTIEPEVDVYARNTLGNIIKVLVCSCKVRYTPVPAPISRAEMEALVRVVIRARQREGAHAASFRKTAEVAGVFFSNTDRIHPDAKQLAGENNIAILCATLSKSWTQRPARVRIESDRVRHVGGADIATFLRLDKN